MNISNSKEMKRQLFMQLISVNPLKLISLSIKKPKKKEIKALYLVSSHIIYKHCRYLQDRLCSTKLLNNESLSTLKLQQLESRLLPKIRPSVFSLSKKDKETLLCRHRMCCAACVSTHDKLCHLAMSSLAGVQSNNSYELLFQATLSRVALLMFIPIIHVPLP